jgi:hypothetical protein
VLLRDLTRAVPGGTFFDTVLTFQNAGVVTLSVQVMPASVPYATFSPAPTPTPTPTPTVTATPGHHKHKHHKPGAGASSTPLPSPSTS